MTPKRPLAQAGEQINAGDMVEVDPKTGRVIRYRQMDVEEVIELSEREDGAVERKAQAQPPTAPSSGSEKSECSDSHDPKKPLTPAEVVARKLKGGLPK
jgi:hypothetical protein